jgi:hypothetical protein
MRFLIFDKLIAPIEAADLHIQIESTEEKAVEDNIIALSKTCRQVCSEYRTWEKAHLEVRMSPQYGLFVPARTMFFVNLGSKSRYHGTEVPNAAALQAFNRFCRNLAHAEVQKVKVDFDCLPNKMTFYHLAKWLGAFSNLRRFEMYYHFEEAARIANWTTMETYEQSIYSQCWGELKEVGFKEATEENPEGLYFKLSDSINVRAELWKVVELEP